jgi:hypothetical protein
MILICEGKTEVDGSRFGLVKIQNKSMDRASILLELMNGEIRMSFACAFAFLVVPFSAAVFCGNLLFVSLFRLFVFLLLSSAESSTRL